MSKPAPSRLAGLKFMQDAAARTTNSSAQAQASGAASSSGSAGRTPASGSVGAAKPAPKVSSKLMGLKFMQKAVQKQAVKEQVKEHAERLEQERFVIHAEHQTRGCVVVHEDTPLVATTTGRMSFGNFNPAVEKSNTELRQLVAEVQEEAARRADTITDEEMAKRLTQSRLPGATVKDEAAAPPGDGVGSGTSAVKVEAESESKEVKKRRRAKSELVTKLKKLKKAKVG